MRLPAIGYAVRDQNRRVLDDPAITAAEITFEDADDPLRIEPFLNAEDFEYVSLHALKLSLASPDPPREDYLDAMKAVALENGVRAVSDHLGFTHDRNDGIELGHFAPPPYTPAALDVLSRNIDHVRDYFGLPLFVENIASLFRFQGTMTEAEFLAKLLERTGCGWLLDATNVYANAVNFGGDPGEFIASVLPSAPRVQMHLAGGYFDERSQTYIDTHSRGVPEEVWELYRRALRQGTGKIDAVFIERDLNFPDEHGWREEIRRARAIAEEVCSLP